MDDLNEEQRKTHLPVVHCRECGSMGWSGLKRKVSDKIESDLKTFLAPNMEWFADYDHLKTHGNLPGDSTLIRNINQRIEWEIVSEYGFLTRIGRTLEKTSSSVIGIDPVRLSSAVDKMLEPIQNEFEPLRKIEPDRLTRFLLGVLIHLKNQGGIYLPTLDAYIESFGNTYLIYRINWMPGSGPNTRTPSFLTTKRGTRFDMLFSSGNIRTT